MFKFCSEFAQNGETNKKWGPMLTTSNEQLYMHLQLMGQSKWGTQQRKPTFKSRGIIAIDYFPKTSIPSEN